MDHEERHSGSHFFYPKDQSPIRLDTALAVHLGLGIRRCRALIDGGYVLVDGRSCAKGVPIHSGQHVHVSIPGDTELACSGVRLVARSGNFAALGKLGGMHTVRGRGVPCLESCLPGLGLDGWRLLNRLDFLTSGLVLATSDAEGSNAYMGWQDAGLICKWYLALARGEVENLEARWRILDDKRRVVRVIAEKDDPLRWTHVCPVCRVDGDTLLLVRIRKGRRHQIRAHLAYAGHPLVGDPIYGVGEPGGLSLHHWRVDIPGFKASFWPDWPCVNSEQVESLLTAFDSD